MRRGNVLLLNLSEGRGWTEGTRDEGTLTRKGILLKG